MIMTTGIKELTGASVLAHTKGLIKTTGDNALLAEAMQGLDRQESGFSTPLADLLRRGQLPHVPGLSPNI